MDGAATGDIPFVRVARLELDELLEQLVDRIHDVQRTQGRLRGLLRAILAVAQGVDLEEVLRHVVTAAKDLVDAKYAALGVIQQGRLVQFVHDGMPPATVEHIGDLPQGKGVLGALADNPRAVRLPDIAEHPASVGFPTGHPPMHTFLGVPIRVGDRTFGNLYLTEKTDGAQFSRDDEDVVAALAGAAAVTIENATLFAESRRRRDWQAAMYQVATTLFREADRTQSIEQLVRHARDAGDASGAAFTAPTDQNGKLCVVSATGQLSTWQGQVIETPGSLAAAVLDKRRTIAVTDPTTDDRTTLTAERTPGLGSIIATPVLGQHTAHGVLCLSYRGSVTFGDADLSMVEGFAAQAAAMLDMADLRHENEQARRAEDRHRIAQDLQQTVIRDLFTVGLDLQGIAARVQPDVAESLATSVERLDRIIHDVRAAVFTLDEG
jgi:GAF domain-containing protein